MRATSQPTPAEQAESTKLRLTFLALLVASLFVLLLARLWFLQVMAGARYAEAAEGNAVRTVAVEAPRGLILDRDGRPLVDNRYANVVSVLPEEMGDEAQQAAVMADLADLLGLTVEQIEQRVARSRVAQLQPKPVFVDAPGDIVAYIHENAATRYPGVYAESLPRRAYPNGTIGAHLLGYVGEISDEELLDPEYADYRQGALIGWAGLEQRYESDLQGIEGERRLEVDRTGEIVGEQVGVNAQPGDDLVTTIDLDAQQLAEESLALGIETAHGAIHRDSGRPLVAPAGAVVVLDPRSGEVRALASFPTYEPTEFVGGVSEDYWSWLQDDANHFPLINRAVQSSYPPGSVFKVVSASAALTDGYATRETQIPCPASWSWGRTFRNWSERSQGPYDLAQSLTHSCDTVFYELAREMWLAEEEAGAGASESLSEEAAAWGFGARTGIDLPNERGGIIPGREWKREYWEDARDTYCTKARTLPPGLARDINADLCQDGAVWRGGDAVNMSIGQGDVQTTPLQVANAFAAIANGGTLWRPLVADRVEHRDGTATDVVPEAIGQVPTSAEDLAFIEQGLLGVTAEGGTAAGTFADFPVRIAGKTGTAEFRPRQPFAWFAGYNVDPGPDGEEYVVVAMVEEGGGGSVTAAPIVRRIFEGLLGLEAGQVETGEATD